MDCLQDYIGYKNATTTVPVIPEPVPDAFSFSGLWVNQLPGVSFEMVEDISEDEQDQDDLKVWADVQMRGLKKFALAVKAELNKCFRITDPVVVSCLVCADKDLFAVALWYFLGVELMIERTSSDRLNRYTTIDLEKAEKLKADFFTEYQAALSDAVQSLNVKDSDCIQGCVACNDNVRWIEQLP